MTSESQHIAQEILLRYVEDTCSRSEMREIDRHLTTCPMCSDAVEGLMLLSEPSVAVANLNKKIDARVAEIGVEKPIETPVGNLVLTVVEETVKRPLKVVKRPFRQERWAAAAAVLLLATGSIWMYNSSQKIDNKVVTQEESAIVPNADTTFDANKTPQYATAESVEKSLNLPQSSASKVDENKNINTVSTGVSDIANEDVMAKLKDKSATNLPTDADFKKLPKQATETEKAVEMDSKIATTTTAAPTSTYSNLPQNDRTRDYPGASQQNSVPRPTLETPSKYETEKKYEDKMADVKASESKENMQDVVVTGTAKAKKSQPPAAANKPQTSQVTPSVPNVSDAILSRADAYFKQKEYEKAVTEYTQFTNSETSGDRYERALFQIASAYVKLNRKAEAKAIFEKLVNMNGQFERASKKALKDL